jgi:hypothetical protein
MNKEQEAIMNKARSKRERRAKSKLARKASERTNAQVADPNATLTEKVIDLAQGAAAHVSDCCTYNHGGHCRGCPTFWT